ncbi:tetratricopeptide repeat-containing serine protease family protein [Amycolatopsis carbonis]|uniref:Tetratricopeptide repeat-containing serine protease family protein n=1 Tax=Amycolatopsis carbonis TaxID=715471 RepID=A0A9Y2MVM6_9PSEU|nr:tetratricopeptide repeat-containing serine protease family protein [Amycolatopsis sp. 2-15]WIX77064.1 tetratricopeptide repeat-containing serine protease family protein [Amycolatopsis sp. 2-15]
MQRTSLVDIRVGTGGRSTSVGSGYLISPTLVITARHVVVERQIDGGPEPAADGASPTIKVRVGHVDDEASLHRSDATVCWHRPDVDVALLRLARPAPFRPGVRWGSLVTNASGEYSGVGYPDFAIYDDNVRSVEQLGGRLDPLSSGPNGTYVLHQGSSPDLRGGHEWSGISGAAVFCAELLVGIVVQDDNHHGNRRLYATRARKLLQDPEFVEIVEGESSEPVELESVEFRHLVEPAPPRREFAAPSMVLRPDAEAVPFHGRAAELDELTDWCLDRSRFSVHVVTGPGGQGKTRLGRELARRLRRRGWVAGLVKRDAKVDRDSPGGVQEPVLLIVDYAETQPELLRNLSAWASGATHPVRLLLLARARGEWERTAEIRVRTETRLRALSDDGSDHAGWFREVAQGLARHLPAVDRYDRVEWSRIAADLVVPPTATRGETALKVEMGALVTLLRQGLDGSGPASGDSVEEELLFHERRYWRARSAESDLGKRADWILARAVAAAVLCPTRTRKESEQTIGRALPQDPSSTVEEVVRVVRDLYPPPAERYWGQLEPDRLAEFHASTEVLADEEFLPSLFGGATDEQRTHLLTVLARAAVAHANDGRKDQAARLVVALGNVLGQPAPDRPLTVAMMRGHSDALPEKSHVLRDYALDVAVRLRDLTEAADGSSSRDYAAAVQNLGRRHAAVGNWAAAVQASEEAAKIRAVWAGPEGSIADRAAHAESLVALSEAARLSGDRHVAYEAGSEALSISRTLIAFSSGVDSLPYKVGLARTLITLSPVLWQLGIHDIAYDDRARSVGYTTEAVNLAREVVAVDPELAPDLLAKALDAHSSNLWRLRKFAEIADPSKQAEEAARTLATQNPDAWDPDLADALLGLSVSLENEDRARRMELTVEAIALLTPLAEDLPTVHEHTLAQLWHNLACDQRDSKELADALDSIGRAIEFRKRAATTGTAIANHAHSLQIRGRIYRATERFQDALDTFVEAHRITDHHLGGLSPGEIRVRADITADLGWTYFGQQKPSAAVKALDQAIAEFRRLTAHAPAVYAQYYAAALHDQAAVLADYDRTAQARTRWRQAIANYRQITDPEEWVTEALAEALLDLGSSYTSRVTTADRAVAPLRDAYLRWTSLASHNPAHKVPLAQTCVDLSHALTMTGQFADAVQVTEREVSVRRQLLAAGSDHANLWLCHALLRLAESQAMTGMVDDAWDTVLDAQRRCQAAAVLDEAVQDQAFLFHRVARALSLCARFDRHSPESARRKSMLAEQFAGRAVTLYRQQVDDSGVIQDQASLNKSVTMLAEILRRLGSHWEAADVEHRRGEGYRERATR